jgi:uncharacterized damage-inducible protein DinB
MANIVEAMMTEIQKEAATTRRILERVPGDKLSWRPHPKSMSLGQLSLHIATIPGNLSKLAQLKEFDASTANFDAPTANSTDETLAALDASVKAAQDYIGSLDEPAVMENWRLTVRGKEVFTVTRLEMLRTIMLNHWYHHRGQLSVYLRLLDVPIPVIYGRSADENPFG